MDRMNEKFTEYRNDIPQKTHSNFDLQINTYKHFLKKIEKSEFKNAYTRYITEINLLKSLLVEAEKENRKTEAEEIKQKIADINKILYEQNGIRLQ